MASNATYASSARSQSGTHGYARMATLVMLACLGIDIGSSLRSILPIQTLTLSSLIGGLMLPLVWLRHKVRLSAITTSVLYLVGYAVVHSGILLVIHYWLEGYGEVRVWSWLRQLVSLYMGFATFLTFRIGLGLLDARLVVTFIALGVALGQSVGVLNLLWGYAGIHSAGEIVSGVRALLGLRAWSTRLSGLSLEPSYFGMYLAIMGLPVILSAQRWTSRKRALTWSLLMMLTLLEILATQSTTSYLITLTLLLLWLFQQPVDRRSAVIWLMSIVALGVGALSFTYSYVTSQFNSFITGRWSVSIVDRIYSTVGPLMALDSPRVLLGAGLGGSPFYFEEIMPEHIRAAVTSVRWEAFRSPNSLVGRIVAELGLIGLVLFLHLIWQAFRAWMIIRRMRGKPDGWISLGMVGGIALVATLLATSLGGLGSFAHPYFWFWIALLDTIVERIRYKHADT